MKVIPKIVVTGGPCAGKTTAMTFLAKRFTEIGYYPLIIPEAATILLSGGVTFRDGMLSPQIFQEQVMDLICALESQFESAARQLSHPKPVLIADRGLMDAKAYIPEQLFWDIACARNMNVNTMRDLRYQGIFHLRTTALGAEEFYTCANNTARAETPEEARMIDEATLQSWTGHPRLHVIDNSAKSIDIKLTTLWEKICYVLGETTLP